MKTIKLMLSKMLKLLICLFILVGCTKVSVSPYPKDYDWTGITYE